MHCCPLLLLLPLLLIAGCASKAPKELGTEPEKNISLATWQAAPAEHARAKVRWGGTILRVENHRDETWLEILASPLDRHSRPSGGGSDGRFIVKVKGFLDPELYPLRRLFTAAGEIDGTIERPIGDYPYLYPVLVTTQYYLWPVEQPKKKSLASGFVPQGPWTPIVDDVAEEYIPF